MTKFLTGLILGLAITSAAAFTVGVTGQGVLEGWTVQKDGETICENPAAYPDFRGAGKLHCL